MTNQQISKLKASAKKLIIKIRNNVTVDNPVSSISSTSCNATCVSVSFDGIESAHCLVHSVTDAVEFSKDGESGNLKGGDLDDGEEGEASDKDDTMAEDVEDAVAPPSPSDGILIIESTFSLAQNDTSEVYDEEGAFVECEEAEEKKENEDDVWPETPEAELKLRFVMKAE